MKNHIKLADTYYRLSDEEKRYGESGSITNQRELVQAYCREHDIIIVEEFVDDGFSGGNFDRPGFQSLLQHLKTGKANMVVTKDLSRLGRDMSEASYYAERYFPEHGIHYIAPNDNFDSLSDNMMAPFQFAMNDVYLRDTSRKVKAVLDSKRNQGKYAACPPYGYKKVPRTTDQLEPDPNTAPVVQHIFELASTGVSTRSIAIRLNEEGIMPPLKYRAECTGEFSEKGVARVSDFWNYTTVKRIICNRAYLGHTILGKTRKASIKSKMKLYLPEDEWVCTENTHQPLVTQEQFDQAAHYLGENTKAYAANPAFRHSIFGGIAFCASCGAAMCSAGSVYGGERKKYWYLACNNLTQRTRVRCEHGARIKYTDLMEIVRCDLNKMISFTDDEIRSITNQAVAQVRVADVEDTTLQLDRAEKQLRSITKMIEKLYRDNMAGYVSDAQLEDMMKKLSGETKSLQDRITMLKAGGSEETEIRDTYGEFFKLVKNFAHIEQLDRQTLHTFVERIEIGEKILPPGAQAAGPKTPYRQSVRIIYRFIGELAEDSIRNIQKAASF